MKKWMSHTPTSCIRVLFRGACVGKGGVDPVLSGVVRLNDNPSGVIPCADPTWSAPALHRSLNRRSFMKTMRVFLTALLTQCFEQWLSRCSERACLSCPEKDRQQLDCRTEQFCRWMTTGSCSLELHFRFLWLLQSTFQRGWNRQFNMFYRETTKTETRITAHFMRPIILHIHLVSIFLLKIQTAELQLTRTVFVRKGSPEFAITRKGTTQEA